MVRTCMSLALLGLAAGTDVRNDTQTLESTNSVDDGAVLVQSAVARYSLLQNASMAGGTADFKNDRPKANWKWTLWMPLLYIAEVEGISFGGTQLVKAQLGPGSIEAQAGEAQAGATQSGGMATMRTYERWLQLPDFLLMITVAGVGASYADKMQEHQAIPAKTYVSINLVLGLIWTAAIIIAPLAAKKYEVFAKFVDFVASGEADILTKKQDITPGNIGNYAMYACSTGFIIVRWFLETTITLLVAMLLGHPEKPAVGGKTKNDAAGQSMLQTELHGTSGFFAALANLDMDASFHNEDALNEIEAALLSTTDEIEKQAKAITEKLWPSELMASMADSAGQLHEVFMSRTDWNSTDQTELRKFLESSGAMGSAEKFADSVQELGSSAVGADGALDGDVKALQDSLAGHRSLEAFEKRIGEFETTFNQDTWTEADVRGKLEPFLRREADRFKPVFRRLGAAADAQRLG